MWETGSFNRSLTVQTNIIRLNFSGVFCVKYYHHIWPMTWHSNYGRKLISTYITRRERTLTQTFGWIGWHVYDNCFPLVIVVMMLNGITLNNSSKSKSIRVIYLHVLFLIWLQRHLTFWWFLFSSILSTFSHSSLLWSGCSRWISIFTQNFILFFVFDVCLFFLDHRPLTVVVCLQLK